MFKRLFQNFKYTNFLENYPQLKLGGLVTALFCTFLIIAATYTQIPVGFYTIFNVPVLMPANIKPINDLVNIYTYIPQIPIVLFTGALLGPRIGFFSIFLYIFLGLIGFPIFASGGGFNYITQPTFGYILGYFAGVFLVGRIMAGNVTNYAIFRASVSGVLAIHFLGIIYLISIMLLNHNSLVVIIGWIWNLSIIQIIYDIVASFLIISLARPIRAILWLGMD
jgi:biotin transport system substrate-specific component